MAYQNFLIKTGEYQIPYKFIKVNTYTSYRNVQDLDSYRDANGVLHRNALEHVACKVEFETPPMMTSTEFSELMQNIQSNFINTLERKVSVTAYMPETNDYITQEMYMPDIKPVINSTFNGELIYNAVRLAFIGY